MMVRELIKEVKKKRVASSNEKASRLLIEKVKQKKEFSELPDSIILRALENCNNDVKESRAFLRKYFGVFLTNRVLKGKGSFEDLLSAHISSKKRNYPEFYSEIFSQGGLDGYMKNVSSIIDLGAGLNGFSYPYLKDAIGRVSYLAVEAAGQEVEHMNHYFEGEGFNGKAVCEDLFDLGKINSLLEKQGRDRVVFLFQVVDALENLEKDFSKKFLSSVSRNCEYIVVSLPTESLGGRKKFSVQRKWLIDFLKLEFKILKDFKMNGERIIVVGTNN